MPPRIAQSKLVLRSAAVLALVTIPTLWIGPPKFWKLPAIELAVIGALCLAYLLAAALAFHRSPPRPPFAPWLVGLAAFGTCVRCCWRRNGCGRTASHRRSRGPRSSVRSCSRCSA
ncbi:MAG: hypothetical protein U1F11_10350 [Steroidobacteraceae bacterium]